MAKQKAPLSVRLDPETDERIELVAEKLGIKKHTLARMAIEAAIDAVEQNDYQLVVPIRFDVKRIAKPKDEGEIRYAPGPSEFVVMEERDSPKKHKGKK